MRANAANEGMNMKGRLVSLLAGFLIAPATPAAMMFVMQVFAVGYRDASEGAFVLLVIGYASAGVLGIPAHLFLQRNAMTGLASYLGVGALIGIAYYGLLFIPTYLNADSKYVGELIKNTIGFGVMGLVGGLVASLVFWLIAVRPSRPMVG
jgi:hypothetical protein